MIKIFGLGSNQLPHLWLGENTSLSSLWSHWRSLILKVHQHLEVLGSIIDITVVNEFTSSDIVSLPVVMDVGGIILNIVSVVHGMLFIKVVFYEGINKVDDLNTLHALKVHQSWNWHWHVKLEGS
jgi:hypothetical protein